MNDRAPEAGSPRLTLLPDLWRLGVVAALALFTHAWVLTHTEVLSRDSVSFIRFALQLEDPPPIEIGLCRGCLLRGAFAPGSQMSRLEVIEATPHAPGYPVALLAISWPVRAIMGGTTADSMVVAAQLTSVLAAVLLIFPMYFLGKMLFDRQTAFVGTMLFQALPVFTAISSDGLSDGFFLLMCMMALWLAAIGFRRQSAPWFLAAGLMGGFAYLVRPEGLVAVLAAGLVLLGCKGRGSITWRPFVLRGAMLTAGLVATGGPYAATIGKITNKPTGEHIISGDERAPTWLKPAQSSVPAGGGNVLLAAWYHGTSVDRIMWACGALVKEVLKTSFYVIPFFALVGFWVSRKRIRDDAAMALLCTAVVCQIGLLIVVGSAAGYVAGRHTLLISLCCCYFAAASFPALGCLFANGCAKFTKSNTPTDGQEPSVVHKPRLASQACWAVLLAVACIAASASAGLKNLHSNRAGHHAAGLWLANQLQWDDMLLDPFSWAEYYSGYMRLPPTHHPKVKRVFVVVEDPETNPHPRLHMMVAAHNIARKVGIDHPCYHWPTDKPISQAKVLVYQWDPWEDFRKQIEQEARQRR